MNEQIGAQQRSDCEYCGSPITVYPLTQRHVCTVPALRNRIDQLKAELKAAKGALRSVEIEIIEQMENREDSVLGHAFDEILNHVHDQIKKVKREKP